MSRILAKYYIETPDDAGKTASVMAKMQSTGTWKDLDGEAALAGRFGAKVESVNITGNKDSYSLPTRYPAGRKVTSAEVIISYPWENFGPKISMLLTTVAGEIFDMYELTAVKLIDIEMPDDFVNLFPGPQFGIEGSRKISGAFGRPLFGAITKPCVGLTTKQQAELAYQAASAGADFIKDDELLADAPYNRIADRAKAVGIAMKKSFRETGKRTMCAVNITDDPDKTMKFHDIVRKGGAGALMFNSFTGGFNNLCVLARYTKLPIHLHRDFAAASLRSSYIGISPVVYVKLARMCGADQIQCGGLGGYLYESDEEMLQSMRACTAPMAGLKPALPVSSGGMWAGKLTDNIKKIGNNDFMFLCGGGVFGHPDGGYAGMRSLFEAWDEYNGRPEGNNLKAAKKAFETGK